MSISGAVGGATGTLWSLLVWIISSLISLLAALLPAAVLGVLTSVWAMMLIVALLASAVLLNLVGVDDVHEVLVRHFPSGNPETPARAVAEITEVDPASVTDESGRFSGSAFETVTGLTPAEFIHLYVQANGGRVWQSNLNTVLPWSKASVSRTLDELEANDVLVRVQKGGRNVVCTPSKVPE